MKEFERTCGRTDVGRAKCWWLKRIRGRVVKGEGECGGNARGGEEKFNCPRVVICADDGIGVGRRKMEGKKCMEGEPDI